MKQLITRFTHSTVPKPFRRSRAETTPAAGDDGLYGHQRRALIEWIARALSLRLANGDPGELVRIAAGLVEREEQEEDFVPYLKQLKLSDGDHRCVYEAYAAMRDEVVTYLPYRAKAAAAAGPDQELLWQAYRDVVFALTHGKLVLIRPGDIDRYREGEALGTVRIEERSDIPRARELAKRCFAEAGFPHTHIMSQLLAVSEAVTNIIKHADDGEMTVVDAGGTFHVVVQDKGPGITLDSLPKATLMAGYSTKHSMGQGYTLMLKTTDAILLSSTPGEGSTVILVFNRKEEKPSHDKSVG